MKLFSYGKDGGETSRVWGFWIIEIKPLFSIVLLCFEKGSREAFHSHAFNALTWFVRGEIYEHHLDGRVINWKPSIIPKYTPRKCFHKVFAVKRTFALSLRGPWSKVWEEVRILEDKRVTLTHGRKIIKEVSL